jgi:putative membrane protein
VIIFDIVFVILLAVVISYLLIIQRYYHFKIVQHGTQLTTNKGFFQTSRVTVRLNRIQSVVYIQSWLRQLLHLTTVQALVAANASDDEKSGGVVIMPVVQSKDVQQQMHAFIDWLPIQDVTGKSRWRANARGRWALIRNRLLIAALICVPICVFLRPFGLLSLIVLPVAWSLGIYTGKKTEIGVTGEKILVAQVGRLFGKKRYYMPKKNIQSMQLSQSILMRQTGLVHLVIRLRSGNTELSIKIRYLPEQDAKAVYAWYRQAYLQ